jgi:Glycosyl transferase family 2
MLVHEWLEFGDPYHAAMDVTASCGPDSMCARGGRETLPVHKPASMSDEFAGGDTPHRLSSPAHRTEQPRLTWVAGSEPRPISAQASTAFRAKSLKLSILMAAYNEENTIARAIDDILKIDCPCEIELIVVDDGSTDTTPVVLSRVNDPRVRVHRQPSNQGKGAALLAAMSMATGTHALPFDADLEYDAGDISRVIEPVLKGRCEVVYGVRLFGYNTVYRSYLYAIGNRLLTRLANILFNARLSDLHTCLKLVPLVTLRGLDLHEKGFGLDSEITARLLSRGVRPFEVPVSYHGRSHAEGKKITWRDAVACTRILFQIRLRGRPRREAAGGLGAPDVAVTDTPSQLISPVSTSTTATTSTQR